MVEELLQHTKKSLELSNKTNEDNITMKTKHTLILLATAIGMSACTTTNVRKRTATNDELARWMNGESVEGIKHKKDSNGNRYIVAEDYSARS
jgi:hypothetical protein